MKQNCCFITKTVERNPALETCHNKTGGAQQDQIIPSVWKHTEASRGFWKRVSSLLDKDGVLLLIVVQAEAVAGAEGDQFPLGVQVESGDHSWRLALDQGKGLEARREQDRLLSYVQSSVSLSSSRGQS